ncbi:MAG: hypothetical protein ACK5V3_11830, partial [Bdellovibrionales bacterium]
MNVRLLLLPFSVFLIGCTAAVPKVSSLGASLFLASKSPNPFEQDNNSGAILFSGNCTALSKSFEFRLDGLTTWTLIPTIAPSPSVGEWLPAGLGYDVNCSDGTYNFYIFISQIILAAENHYGTLPSEYEPTLVELRTLDDDGVIIPGTINFERPRPVAFRINNFSGPEWFLGILEVNQPIKFEVSLISNLGQEVKAYPSPVILDLTPSLAAGTSPNLGDFYGDDCNTPVTLDMRTFTTDDRRKTFCYKPNSVSAGARIRLTVSGGGLIDQSHEFNVVALDSVYLQLKSFNDGSQRIPKTLVKGANYRMTSNLTNFYNPSLNRKASSFTGNLIMTSGSSEVSFSSVGNFTGCPGTGTSAFSCASSFRTSVPFSISVAAASSLNELNLDLSAIATTPCGNCFIEYTGPTYQPIQSYQAQRSTFQLAPSSLSYTRPVVEFPNQSLRHGECREMWVSLGNSSGHTLPAPALAPTLR